jgi:hypothetical protein
MRRPNMIRAAVRDVAATVLRRFRSVRRDDEYAFVVKEVMKTLVWKHVQAVERMGNKRVDCSCWSEAAFDELIHRQDPEADRVGVGNLGSRGDKYDDERHAYPER